MKKPVEIIFGNKLRNRFARVWHFVGLLLMLIASSIFCPDAGFAARDEVPLEYKLKAAFTFNFIKFIEWPEGFVNGGSSAFTLYVLGSGPINDALSGLDGKEISGRIIKVREVNDFTEVKQHGILFVNTTENYDLSQIVKRTRETGVLTISEMDGFCQRGGIINFLIQDDSINFEINLVEAKRSGLSISYKLLNQAIKIYR